MNRYLLRILKFYLVVGALCACGYAALLLGGYFDEAPMVGYIRQDAAGGAFPEQIAGQLGDDLVLNVVSVSGDPLEQARTLLEQGALALVLDMVQAPEDPAAFSSLAAEYQIPMIWLGEYPGRAALEYENCWYVGSDPAQAGELLGQEAAMLFRDGTAADQNGDLLLQYVWAGNTGFSGSATLKKYILDECEHYGVYTADAGSLSAGMQDLAEQAALELAEPAAQPEILFFSDPQALEAMELARPSLAWWGEGALLPVLTTAGSETEAAELIESGRALAVAWYDGAEASRLTAAMLQNAATLSFVGQGQDIQPDGQTFAIPYQLMTA